jgi:hypothetical protein
MQKHKMGWLKLADHVVLSRTNTDILFSGDAILKFPNCSPQCIEFAFLLREGMSAAEIEARTALEDCREIIHILKKLEYLVPYDTNPWKDEPFAKHFSYFAGLGLNARAAQNALLGSHVVFIGVGGTGGVVLQHLVGAGVKHFTLIDPDDVETTNLNRQFVYERGDVGRSKVDAAAKYVRARLPDACVELRRASVKSSSDLENLALCRPVSFILNAADYPACQVVEAVAEFSATRSVPFLGGSCGFLEGSYGPLVTPGGARAYLRSHRLAMARAAALGTVDEPMQAVSFSPLNTVVGALMARDIIEYLAGGTPFSLGHYVWIDLRQTAIFRRPVSLDRGERP